MHHFHLSLLTDFYEFSMANGYFENDRKDTVAYFEMFFRRVPDQGGFAIMAGVQQLIAYLQGLRFDEKDIAYLAEKKMFSNAFLDYLANFRFSCDVWAVPEGSPIFPNEPVVTVRGPVIEAQLIETMVLLTINHQSLIATKANRMVRAAQGRGVLEFGSRRAQGYDGAVYGARAAYLAGCMGSSCTLAEQEFGIPVVGTMAHSWIQMFPSELEAFRAYAKTYPENCTLLVDTYSVLQSGLPNAMRVFQEELLPRGCRPKGIRIDSGDIAYLSKEARKLLDAAGFWDCKIVASNSLDEWMIRDMLMQEAQVDLFGVGERLITAKSEPVFGGVYKLVAVEEAGQLQPKIKLSENVGKMTIPGFKQIWRFFDNASGKAMADVLAFHHEEPPAGEEYVIFDPEFSWKRKKMKNYSVKKLLTKIFENGKPVYESPGLKDIREYCKVQTESLWEEVKRFENPHHYDVDLSKELWDTREKLLAEFTSK